MRVMKSIHKSIHNSIRWNKHPTIVLGIYYFEHPSLKKEIFKVFSTCDPLNLSYETDGQGLE
jgi:hypothetical protein